MTGRERRPNLGPRRISPEDLKRFPRRRCVNCDKLYYVTRKIKRFCSTLCKDEYHRHGSAYGPLKDQLLKLIAKTGKEEAARQFEAYLSSPEFRKHLAAAGFIHRSQILKPDTRETGAYLRGQVTVIERLLREHEERIVALETWRATGHLVGLLHDADGPRNFEGTPAALDAAERQRAAATGQVDFTKETTAPCPDKPARRSRTKK